MDKQATYDDISEVIKEQVDNFRFRRPCIMRGHKLLISKTESEIISYDQSINDYIIEQLNNSESHDFIIDLTEFGMAASHVTFDNHGGIHIKPINQNAMHAVIQAEIGGLKHDILIADEISLSKMKETSPKAINEDFFQEEKQPKENHPYGWYRKFEKKRF